MSEKDLVKELKAEIVEITKDRDDALTKMKAKETRMKQVLIKLEHREQDIHTCGSKIGEQNKLIADLQANLNAKKEQEQSLSDEKQSVESKLERANKLLQGLGGEKARWTEAKDKV